MEDTFKQNLNLFIQSLLSYNTYLFTSLCLISQYLISEILFLKSNIFYIVLLF